MIVKEKDGTLLVRSLYTGLVCNVTATHPGPPSKHASEVRVHFFFPEFLNFWLLPVS